MDAALLSQMSLFRFRFADCIVKIANTNWKNSLNDCVKKNLQARKQLDRNHGDQNKQERGRLITVEDYKNGSKHQTSEEIERFAKRTFLC